MRPTRAEKNCLRGGWTFGWVYDSLLLDFALTSCKLNKIAWHSSQRPPSEILAAGTIEFNREIAATAIFE